MTRQEVYDELKKTFGEVPSYLEGMKDDRALELEWELIKRFEFDPAPIPDKYRDLIGIAVSAATGCDHCVYYTKQMARLHGATEEEIAFTGHYAKFIAGWAPFSKALELNLDEFKRELDRSFDHYRKTHEREELRRAA